MPDKESGKDFDTNKKKTAVPVNKWWFWVIVVVLIAGVAAAVSGGSKKDEGSNDNGGSDGQTSATVEKDDLELLDGWSIDNSSQFATYVDGYVQNNMSKDVENYIQITFNAYDAEGASVGTCVDNGNHVDAGGKWKFHAYCSGSDIAEVKFDKITNW